MKKRKKTVQDRSSGVSFSPRNAALEALAGWHESRKPVNVFLDPVCLRLSGVDRQLASRLVYGVLSHLEYLDHVIGRFSTHPVQKMKPETLMALRLGVYQLLLLDRIPESAAVNETVKAFKAGGRPAWLVSFVNGVLRTVTRERHTIPDMEHGGKDGGEVLNHPEWLLKRWQRHYGEETAARICRINNQQAHTTLRVNTAAISVPELLQRFQQEGLFAHQGSYAPDAVVLEAFTGSVMNLPGFREGHFQVQDEAAQLVSYLLGPFAGKRSYLDACAGLGGKTTHVARLASPDSEIVAVEPDARRFQLLQENLERQGVAARVRCIQDSLEAFAQDTSKRFDAILLDAPCSGTGVIRRHPDIRWNRQPADLKENQQIQSQLLDAALTLLRPGGILVYATCSLEPEENQEVITAFLKRHPDCTAAACQPFLPSTAAMLVNRQGFFAPLPSDGLDGFFGARLELRC